MKKCKIAPGHEENKLQFFLVKCRHCGHVGWWGRKLPYLVRTRRKYSAKIKSERGGAAVTVKPYLYLRLGQNGMWRCAKCRSIQYQVLDPLRYAIFEQWGIRMVNRIRRGFW